MSRERDLFANFARARREVDELFGAALAPPPARSAGFTPAVDVYYVQDPPRAVVQADLAGVDPAAIALEIRGRELILAGRRGPTGREERVYQQLEIPQGAFRRVVSVGAEVDVDAVRASYANGLLVVELPLVASERTAIRVTGPGAA